MLANCLFYQNDSKIIMATIFKDGESFTRTFSVFILNICLNFSHNFKQCFLTDFLVYTQSLHSNGTCK